MIETTKQKKEKLVQQLFIGKICDVIGNEKTLKLLKEANEEIEKAFTVKDE